MARRALVVILSVLALFLLGTLLVLSSVSYYLHIDTPAYIEEAEISRLERLYNDHTTIKSEEKIPRIIHQTWKTGILPDRWRIVSQSCKDLMPDYEYMLWTDESSRTFIEEYYPWFLDTFDGYKYPIQRADAIRYFVLHHYGGIYMDLDVGCIRRMDPLLHYQVILPKTIPVGVSNDLMFSAKGHPFMEQTIRKLVTFDHSWIINYPTVMFSTGPMFLSAQYGIYTAAHPPTLDNPGGEVRILPKSLYGKNARFDEAPNAFFSHHYGSSWHADDAAFITFLGRSGMTLVWIGFFILLLGIGRVIFQKGGSGNGRSIRRRLASARYYLLLPRRLPTRGGGVALGIFGAGSASTTTNVSPVSSPTNSRPTSPTSAMPLLPYSFDVESNGSTPPPEQEQATLGTTAAGALRRAGAWARSHVPGNNSRTHRGHSRTSWGSASDMLFFLPALMPSAPGGSSSTPPQHAHRSSEGRNAYPPRPRSKNDEALEDLLPRTRADVVSPPPPPYASRTSHRIAAPDGEGSESTPSRPSTSSYHTHASSSQR